MNGLLTIAFLALVAAAVAMLAVLLAGRALRLRAERRRDRLVAAPRRELLAYLADGGTPEGLAELAAVPGAAWRALEPSAIAMLGKVRGEAGDALAAVFQRRGTIERALADLGSRDPVRRARAANMLGALRVRQAVPALCGLLADRDPDARAVAVRALGAIGDPAAAAPMIATLVGGHAAPAHQVAYALATLDPAADPALLAALGHPEASVRATVLDALRLRGTVRAEPAVVPLLHGDGSPEVRRRAAALLGRLGTRSALDPLVTVLARDPSVAVRAEAARALGELGHPGAVPPLSAQLPDAPHQVAHRAAAALARLGPPGLEALRAAVDRGTEPAAGHAREALAGDPVPAGDRA